MAPIQQNTSTDHWIYTFLLAALFGSAPLFPQHIYPGFFFFFQSTLFLLTGFTIYRRGFDTYLAQMAGSPIVIPFLVTILLLSLSLFISPDVYLAKKKIIRTIGLFLLYGLLLTGPTSRRFHTCLLVSLVIGGIIAACHGLYHQWVGHEASIASLNQSHAYPDDMRQEMIRSLQANRAFGRFGNPNQLAGYLLLCLWPLWVVWKQAGQGKKRYAWILSALVLVGGIYATFSRSGLLGLILTLCFMAAYQWSNRRIRISWKKAGSIAVGIFFLCVVAVLYAGGGILGGRLMTVSTIVARIHFFRGALSIIQAHPFLGVGAEGFEQYYCGVLRPGDLEAHYVHNIILERCVENGFFGLLVFAWFVMVIYRYAYQKLLGNEEIRISSYAALGAFSVFLLLSLVDFHNNLVEMWLVPIFLLGRISSSHVKGNIKPFSVWLKTGCVLLLIMTWIFLVWFRYTNETARSYGNLLVLENEPYQAAHYYERAVKYDRTDAESWRRWGYIWGKIATPQAQQKRLECMKQAVRWAPRRASIRADFADTLFALGYTQQALSEMLEAQRLFPARPRYYERAASYYRFLGQTQEADAQQQKADAIKQQIEANRL